MRAPTIAPAGTELSEEAQLAAALGEFRTESGRILLQLTQESPVLLIFLRHFGCTFCRETLDRVSRVRAQIEARGVRPVFVHLGTPERAKPYFDYYQLADAERVSDPHGTLYAHPVFHLPRTHPASHLLKAAVWKAWLRGAIRAYGIGLIREDGHQMPGVFFLRAGKIAGFFRYRTIADEPDFVALTRA